MSQILIGSCALPTDEEDPFVCVVALLDPSWTLNELVQHYPEAIAVLSQYRLDTCCGGSRTIADAAKAQGISLGSLFSDLDSQIAPSAAA